MLNYKGILCRSVQCDDLRKLSVISHVLGRKVSIKIRWLGKLIIIPGQRQRGQTRLTLSCRFVSRKTRALREGLCKVRRFIEPPRRLRSIAPTRLTEYFPTANLTMSMPSVLTRRLHSKPHDKEQKNKNNSAVESPRTSAARLTHWLQGRASISTQSRGPLYTPSRKALIDLTDSSARCR